MLKDVLLWSSIYIFFQKKDDWGLNNELWRCKSEMNNG